MHSPQMEKATDQVCFQGCCPYPIFRVPGPEPVTVTLQTIATNRCTAAVCRHNFTAMTKSSFFPNTHFTNHESIPSLQESFIQFLRVYPKYTETVQIDEIRAREYGKLSVSNHVCFDYAGIGLLSQSQVMSQYNSTTENAHDFVSFGLKLESVNLKSHLLNGGEELEYTIKKRIMDFLRISQNEYCMVFTENRSSAFKLVAESYPFQSSRKLLTVYDHESEALEAMISTSEKRGARVMASEFKWPGLRIHSEDLRKLITRKNKKSKHRGLFVFPLQSRVTGTNYSYQWMTMAQQHGWHVLLDACALGPKTMDTFGLSLIRPDFLICSFYKIFGENPTGFGCLFVRKSTAQLLQNSTGAGIASIVPDVFGVPEDSSRTDIVIEQKTELLIDQDSVNTSVSQADPDNNQQSRNKISADTEVCDTNMPEKESITVHKKLDSSKKAGLEKNVIANERHARNENESLKVECRCLDQVDTLGLTLISNRGRYLINWLISALMKFHHPSRLDDFPLVKIYGPKVKFNRGQGLAFNIHDWKGEKIEPVLVQKLADSNNISLGHGFLHHIWFPEKSEADKQRIIHRNMKENETERIKSRKGEKGISVVTVSLTFLADFEDIYKLWTFVAQFLDADFVERERWRYTALN